MASKGISVDFVGTYRTIPTGTSFWSVENQMSLITTYDVISKITNVCVGNEGIFVKPCQVIFEITPLIIYLFRYSSMHNLQNL